MPITPGSDVVIMDAPPLADNLSSPSSEVPPLVSDLPSLSSVSSIGHILVDIPCPACQTMLTAPTSRGHLRGECGGWLRWADFHNAINRESITTGANSITFERLGWIVKVFATTIPDIAIRLDRLQDAQNTRTHVRRWYALEDTMMGATEHTNARIHSIADDVAALHIRDQI